MTFLFCLSGDFTKMGRHRRFKPVTMTTIGVTLDTLEQINQHKQSKETQDHFIKRVLVQWNSAKEVIKDLQLAEEYKDKRIEQYESEIDRLRKQVENNPVFQELR